MLPNYLLTGKNTLREKVFFAEGLLMIMLMLLLLLTSSLLKMNFISFTVNTQSEDRTRSYATG